MQVRSLPEDRAAGAAVSSQISRREGKAVESKQSLEKVEICICEASFLKKKCRDESSSERRRAAETADASNAWTELSCT